MKTQFKAALLMLSLIFMGAICSCDKKSSDKDDDDAENVKLDEKTVQELIDKYNEGEWTEADCSKAIDIYEKFGDMALEKLESIIKKADSREEVENDFEKLINKYRYIEELYRILKNADEDEMGEKNYRRFKKVDDRIDDQSEILWEKVDDKFGRPEPIDYGYDSAGYYDTYNEVAPEADYQDGYGYGYEDAAAEIPAYQEDYYDYN